MYDINYYFDYNNASIFINWYKDVYLLLIYCHKICFYKTHIEKLIDLELIFYSFSYSEIKYYK